MSASPARFTFDLDFGAGHDPQSASQSTEPVAVQLREARAKGHAEGLAEGERSALARAAQKQAQAIEALADRAAGAVSLYEDAATRHREEAVLLATTVARKLAAHLLARQPAAELDALFVDCLASLHDTPHVLICCHPQIADAVREAAQRRAALTGFAGRIVVAGDEAIGLSDGHIEWADGGLTRDIAHITAQIEARVGAFVGTSPAKGDLK